MSDLEAAKRGKWKCYYDHLYCSNCGWQTKETFRHCPGCGAEMDKSTFRPKYYF